MITLQELQKQLYYDTKTGNFTWILAKHGVKKDSIAGHITKEGYKSLTINYKKYLIHRLVWFYVNKKWPTEFIDHINGNKLDNRIENLREATNSQNNFNAKLSKKNTSGCKGIVFNKNRKKWQAQIGFNNKYIYLGLFENFELAKQAINDARKKYHDQYANNGI